MAGGPVHELGFSPTPSGATSCTRVVALDPFAGVWPELPAAAWASGTPGDPRFQRLVTSRQTLGPAMACSFDPLYGRGNGRFFRVAISSSPRRSALPWRSWV